MKKIIAGVGILAIVVITFFILSDSSPTQSLQARDFLGQYQKTPGAVLVDVRTPQEFRAGHIAGAINVDFENISFSSEIEKLDTTKTYFVYCRSGNRSEKAIAAMKEQGVSFLYELEGGISSNQSALTLVAGG